MMNAIEKIAPQSLGGNYHARVDSYNLNNQRTFEVHVYRKQGTKLIEQGIWNADGSFKPKHDIKVAPNLPIDVRNQLKGTMISELRKLDQLPAKGYSNIKSFQTEVGSANTRLGTLGSLLFITPLVEQQLHPERFQNLNAIEKLSLIMLPEDIRQHECLSSGQYCNTISPKF